MKRWVRYRFLCSAILTSVLAACLPLSGAALYVGASAGSWGTLTRITLPDKATNSVYAGTGFISGMSYDPVEDDLYFWHRHNFDSYLYRDTDPSTTHSGNTDRDELSHIRGGTNARNRFSAVSIDFDPLTRHYYTCFSNSPTGVRDPLAWIQKRHADTGAYTDIYVASRSGHEIKDVAVDPLGNSIYWTDEDAGAIYRRDLDGAFPVQTLYTGLTSLRGIAIDRGSNSVFWAEYGHSGAASRIASASMDGGGTPFTLLTYPAGGNKLGDLTLDPVSGIVYFTEYLSTTGQTIVRQMTTSGADVQDFTNGAGSTIQGSSVHFSGENVVVPPAEPPLLISNLTLMGANTLQLQISGKPNTTYALFADPDLQSGFDDAVGILSGSLTTDENGATTVTVSLSSGRLYYRLDAP